MGLLNRKFFIVAALAIATVVGFVYFSKKQISVEKQTTGAAEVIVVDAFIDMNGSPVGTQTSPAIMSAGTKDPGINWQVNDSVAAMKVGPQRFNLPAPVRVGNTTYPVDYAHQSLQYDTSYSFNTFRGFFAGDYKALTASGYLTPGIPDQGGSGSLSDLVRIHLSQGAGSVMQLYNGNGPGYVLNIEAYGGNTTHSAKIPVTPGATYWYSYKADYVAGKAYLNVYNTPNFNLVGSVTLNTQKGNIEYIQYGNGQEAQSSGRGINFNYFEISLIDYSNAVFPLVPGSPGTTPTKTSDLNTDGKVDVIDLGILLSAWGQTTKPKSDINQDGKVDVVDLGILLSKWGT